MLSKKQKTGAASSLNLFYYIAAFIKQSILVQFIFTTTFSFQF